MNESKYQAITNRNGVETERITRDSFQEAFEAIWPAMEAAGLGATSDMDGRVHDRDFIYFEMAAGVAFRDGQGGSWLIVNDHSRAFTEV